MAVADGALDAIQTIDGVPLKVMLRRAERMRKLKALALIAPLFVFIMASFIFPILSMLFISVQNPQMGQVLPNTSAQLQLWDGHGFPDETVLQAFSEELIAAKKAKTHGRVGQRLNYEISGFRSLIIRTARKMPAPDTPNLLEAMIEIDKRWAEEKYWQAMKKAAPPYTVFYLLRAMDLKIDVFGDISAAPKQQSIYLNLLERTVWMSVVVTVLCLLMAFPIAYLLATLPTKQSNLLLILLLLPFWTSLLVRTTAWVVLLQSQGLVNDLGILLGLWSEPLELIYNRLGTYIAMIHILLPLMVLPMYAVMKGISPSHMRAAASLGANPLRSFLIVYLPQTVPGVGAGVLLVFILSLGYYITPALVGGPKDQMLSFFIAFYTNQTVNWGMAAALSLSLLAVVLVFFGLYNRLVGIDKMRAN